MANSADPDETARYSVCTDTVCIDIYVGLQG